MHWEMKRNLIHCINFITAVWNQSHKISEIFLYKKKKKRKKTKKNQCIQFGDFEHLHSSYYHHNTGSKHIHCLQKYCLCVSICLMCKIRAKA